MIMPRISSVAVVGLGNVLVGDDGFGPTAVRLLDSRYETGDAVSVMDLGTPGLDLMPHIAGFDALIVMDTVVGSERPGTVKLYRRADLMAGPVAPRTNPHQPGLGETLRMLELQEQSPSEVLLVGVVPGRVETGVGLTAPIRAAIYEAQAEVIVELIRLGHRPRLRQMPRDPDIWWARPPGADRAGEQRPQPALTGWEEVVRA